MCGALLSNVPHSNTGGSEKLVTTHNVLLRIREDLGPREQSCMGVLSTSNICLARKSTGTATGLDYMGVLIGKTGLDFSVTLSLPLPVRKRLLSSAKVKFREKMANQRVHGLILRRSADLEWSA